MTGICSGIHNQAFVNTSTQLYYTVSQLFELKQYRREW